MIVISAKEVMFMILPVFVCWLVCCLVCEQDYTDTTNQISMSLGWRTVLSPEQTLLTFDEDPDKKTDTGFFSHFYYILKQSFFFFYNIFIN